MPTLSVFYGIVIRMYFGDHSPPHFHALYAGHQAQFDIKALRVIKGSLPRQAESLVLTWASAHQSELLEAWEACSKTTQPKPIKPLE